MLSQRGRDQHTWLGMIHLIPVSSDALKESSGGHAVKQQPAIKVSAGHTSALSGCTMIWLSARASFQRRDHWPTLLLCLTDICCTAHSFENTGSCLKTGGL